MVPSISSTLLRCALLVLTLAAHGANCLKSEAFNDIDAASESELMFAELRGTDRLQLEKACYDANAK